MNLALDWYLKNTKKVERILKKNGFKDTDDIGQLIAICLIRKGDKLKTENNVSGFVYTISINIARNEVRKLKNSISIDDPKFDIDIAHYATPEAILIKKQVEKELNNQIELLPKTQNKAVRLFMHNDVKLKDYGPMIQVNPETFKANFRHAKMKLRETASFEGMDLGKTELVKEMFDEESY